MIYTITLNPALDYDIYLDNFKKAKLNLSKKINFRAGGKGINVSIMLKNLENTSYSLGYIAGFTGKYILNSLDEMKINHNFIHISGITRINVKINDELDETEIAGISPKIGEKDIEKLKEYISKLNKDDILVLAGSIPNSLKNDIYKEFSMATKAKIVLDTRGNLLLQNIHNNLLIKPNIKELEDVFSIKIETDEQIYELCQTFINQGVENVLVSMGSKGAILVKKGKYLKADIPKGIYINSIGSGDSMVAGFIHAHTKNLDDIESLKLAVACGSATAYSYGIGEKELVNKLKNSIKIQEVII
ncbi:1-phosphofructokinase [Oceanivirga salmonicida]|uniref:1-phosphofructokinase n=1 Tax=Oceanivirga salmonicida TaxID=1769291 RepID=UPI00082A8876|nr:1-phosphofructokinase [Oceanivirga salmonicida]